MAQNAAFDNIQKRVPDIAAGPVKLRIGDILVRGGIITEEQLAVSLEKQRLLRNEGIDKLIGQIIADSGFASPQDIERAAAVLHKTQINEPLERRKKDNNFYRMFVSRVIERVGRDKYIFAAGKKDETRDIHIINTLNSLRILTHKECFEILKSIVSETMFSNVIIDYTLHDIVVADSQVYYRNEDGTRIKVIPVFFPLDTVDFQLLLSYDDYCNISLETCLQKTEEKGEIISFTFRDIVRDALRLNASDIHIVPKGDHYRVFFRIDGRLVEMHNFLMNSSQGVDFTRMIRIEASKHTKGSFNIDETKVSQLGRIEYTDIGVSLRLEFVPDGRSLEHVDTTARLISKPGLDIIDDLTMNLSKCGFQEEDIPVIEAVSRRSNGLCVVSGMVNSGKSTTILNILPALERSKKIGTVEDPVECVLNRPNIVQHQIFEPENEALHMGFEKYIRSFKRGDYNVVFVGEWRKGVGLSEAIVEQANAGQLIFTTLHIKSSFEIYSALEEIFGLPKRVSARLLILSLNQILLPKLCPKCKQEDKIFFSSDDVRYLNFLSAADRGNLLSFTAEGYKRNEKGCDYCFNTGYKGRTMVYDYFLPTQNLIDEVIKNDLSPNDVRQFVLKESIAKTKVTVFMDRLREGVLDKRFIEAI